MVGWWNGRRKEEEEGGERKTEAEGIAWKGDATGREMVRWLSEGGAFLWPHTLGVWEVTLQG